MANGNNNGTLKIRIISEQTAYPVTGAVVSVASTGTPDEVIEERQTDSDGIIDGITLETPPLEYSMEPSDNQPYSEYNLKIKAPGFEPRIISGVQMFTDEKGIQSVKLRVSDTDQSSYNPTVIGAHTLWEEYPPKIAEDEIKTVAETGEIVLSRVVIPETIVVHDGAPSDPTAIDYYVPYKDYIKNVASNEIYSTWPDASFEPTSLQLCPSP